METLFLMLYLSHLPYGMDIYVRDKKPAARVFSNTEELCRAVVDYGPDVILIQRVERVGSKNVVKEVRCEGGYKVVEVKR